MPERRTQQQRRETTRRRLLDAATDVLVTDGYARLTTTKVVDAAGLSQGALFKHFPAKLDLVEALARDLYEGLARDYAERFGARDPDVDPIGQGIAELWEVFSSPRQAASTDLTVACRTDVALRERLEPIVLEHRERMRGLADDVRVAIGLDDAAFAPVADLVVLALQGLAITDLAAPAPVEQRLGFIHTAALALTREAP